MMATIDVRDVLDRLSRGEITADQADNELERAENHPQIRPDDQDGAATVTPTAESRDSVAVHASLNGSGHVLVVGSAVTCPEVHGPAEIAVREDDAGGWSIHGEYADGSEVAIPSDVDLAVQVNGGAVSVTNVHGSLQGDFNVGDVTIAACLDRGESSIQANAGQVVVALTEGSDVRVMLRAGASSSADPAIRSVGPGEWVAGEGRSSLTVRGHLGELILRDATT